MDVKTKTIQLAKVYEAIANARSILEELEEKATRLASNEVVQMGEVVDQCLLLKNEQEQMLIHFVEAVTESPAGVGRSKSDLPPLP